MSSCPKRTCVAIIGGGPAGMLLSHVLDSHGIDNVVLERRSRDYVLSRIRAGVLEAGSVKLLRDYGLSERMDRIGRPKNGSAIVWQHRPGHFIDTFRWSGKQMMAYGQTAITEDLYASRERDGALVFTEAANVALHELTTDSPYVTFEREGRSHRLDCEFVAGCDGFHGVTRQSIPFEVLRSYERVYPFGWVGIIARVPPLENFTYCRHERGFALAAQRGPQLSRCYVQCSISDSVEDWPDDRFWEEFTTRFPAEEAAQIVTGPSIEKSIAPLRSFVAEPMRHGRLFLAGDAAHIVPPTGAKGLNLAFSDVFYLSRALVSHYRERNDRYLDGYSDMALRRVWAAENFSWRMTKLLHVFPDEDSFEQKLRQSGYDMLLRSEPAQHLLAHEYIGLPYED